MNPKLLFKQILPHITAISIFVAVSYIYFYPLLQGKDLPQGDSTQATGMAQELVEYEQETGEDSRWTNSAFGGMPAYQVRGTTIRNIFSYINRTSRLGIHYLTAGIFFIYLLGFYVLLAVLKYDRWLAIAGALAFALGSYNLIIIIAGHVTKAYAIGLMAPVIAGLLLLFQKKYIAGGLLTTIGLGVQFAANHFQITYYVMLLVVIIFIAKLVEAVLQKEIKHMVLVGVISFGALILAIAPNTTNLWTTYEYGKETLRGESELSPKEGEKKSTGLDKDYALGWSYGKAESFTLLIPNFSGGGSSTQWPEDGETIKALQGLQQQGVPSEQVNAIFRSIGVYWGDMPFTLGPVYYGAVIGFLFVFGLFLVKNSSDKWWLVAATILSLFLAWGRHFEAFTDFLFYNLPLYNKFRTVSMALVIAGLTIPLLGFMALKRIYEGEPEKKAILKALKFSLGITAGLVLIFAVAPTLFLNFSSDSDDFLRSRLAQIGWPEQMLSQLFRGIKADRASILQQDAWRSLVFILLTGGLLWVYTLGKLKKNYLSIGLILLVLVDLWPVARRYLNETHFEKKSRVENQFIPSKADELILKDRDLNFRVFNAMVNPFQDARTSYFHKSIGGYHGAKLMRYNELINSRLGDEVDTVQMALRQQNRSIEPIFRRSSVLNMLNTRYIIYSSDQFPIVNMHALGNAWFVNQFEIVPNADEELAALNTFNPAKTAIIDKRFESYVANLEQGKFFTSDTGTIILTEYKPNHLTYESENTKEQLAVFSEIYYDKGWNAYLDGKLVDHFRVNYVLRAMVIPEGKHKIEFKFQPKSYAAGQTISTISSILIALLLVAGFAKLFLDWKKRLAEMPEPTLEEMKNYEPDRKKPSKKATKSIPKKQKPSSKK